MDRIHRYLISGLEFQTLGVLGSEVQRRDNEIRAAIRLAGKRTASRRAAVVAEGDQLLRGEGLDAPLDVDVVVIERGAETRQPRGLIHEAHHGVESALGYQIR